jgi:hypothetical protein
MWCPLFPLFICASSAAMCSMREQATQPPFIPFYQTLPFLSPPLLNPLSSSLLGSDLHICAWQSTPFELCEAWSLLHAFNTYDSAESPFAAEDS